MRLIDADALIDRIESDKKQDNISPGKFFLFKAYIMNAPTIEPDSDTISRSQAIKDVSEWATDILHPDRLVKEDAIYILESLPSAEQVTGKLNNPDDSLLTADSEACKEQKSKLDTISRQDALAEFRDGRDVYDIMESIEQLPSAEPKTGEWLWDSGDGEYFCSECKTTQGNSTTEIISGEWNFCPNCGARMYKGGEDE